MISLGNSSSGVNSDNHSSSFQPLSLEANPGASPVRRLTFDDDLEAELEASRRENRFKINENFDSDDGPYINKRTRAASSTSAFDQEEDANLDFATTEKSTHFSQNSNLAISFPKGIVNSHKPTTTSQITRYLSSTPNVRKLENTETTKSKETTDSKEEKQKRTFSILNQHIR